MKKKNGKKLQRKIWKRLISGKVKIEVYSYFKIALVETAFVVLFTCVIKYHCLRSKKLCQSIYMDLYNLAWVMYVYIVCSPK